MSGDDYVCKATPEGQRIFDNLSEELSSHPSEEEVKSAIKGTSLDYVGQGRSRVVLTDTTGQYLHERNACVVKIQKDDSKPQNESEVEVWNTIDEESRKWFVPITDYDDDYNWLVQPYLDEEVTKEQLCELEVELLKNGWELEDVNERNAVRMGDHAAMVDYGLRLNRVDFDIMSLEERIHTKKWKHEQLEY